MSSIMNTHNHNFESAFDADERMHGFFENDPSRAETIRALSDSRFHRDNYPTVNLTGNSSGEDNAWLASASVILLLIFIAGIFLNLLS